MATVLLFDATKHTGKVSKEGACAQGGRDTCRLPAEFSVISEVREFSIAACAIHLAGAVRDAEKRRSSTGQP